MTRISGDGINQSVVLFACMVARLLALAHTPHRVGVAETDIPLGRRGSAPRLLSAVYSDGKKGGI